MPNMDKVLHSWMYVSTCQMSQIEMWKEFDDLVELSRARNATLEVTGALLFSGTRFVQFIEGPLDGVSALQNSIRADPRHRDVITLSSRLLDKRTFPDWSLAYNGSSQFVEKVVDRALASTADGSRQGVDMLLRLLKEFV
jgi:hypothetical protein